MGEQWQGSPFKPNFAAEALDSVAQSDQVAIFIAKAIFIDESIQAAMIATKLVLAILNQKLRQARDSVSLN